MSDDQEVVMIADMTAEQCCGSLRSFIGGVTMTYKESLAISEILDRIVELGTGRDYSADISQDAPVCDFLDSPDIPDADRTFVGGPTQ